MCCPIEKVAFELLVGWAVDADAGVPLGFAAALGSDWTATIRDRIALELDRVAAAVADLASLSLLECMMAFGREKHEPVSVSDVLHVCQTTTLAISAFAFVGIYTVFVDELPVEQSRILAGLDPASDIEPIAVA